MLLVTRDPVSHDDQARQGKLAAPARCRHIRERPQIQTQFAGDPVDEPPLDLGPLAFAVSCGAGGPETVDPGHQAVVPGYQRPYPVAGRRAPAHLAQARADDDRARPRMVPPGGLVAREPLPVEADSMDLCRQRVVLHLKRGSCLTDVVKAAQQGEQGTTPTATTIVKTIPYGGR